MMEDRCYCCGKQGVIKSRCPTCNLNASQRTDVVTNHINHYTAQTRSPQLILIDITFCGIKGRVRADTGSSHSISGERMFQIFKDKGLLFQETSLVMSLADGQHITGEALTTKVMVEIEGRSVLTKLIILPKAKGNRTLLGTDFLSSAGLVLDVKDTCWYFWDNPTHKYPFGEELDTPSIVEKILSGTWTESGISAILGLTSFGKIMRIWKEANTAGVLWLASGTPWCLDPHPRVKSWWRNSLYNPEDSSAQILWIPPPKMWKRSCSPSLQTLKLMVKHRKFSSHFSPEIALDPLSNLRKRLSGNGQREEEKAFPDLEAMFEFLHQF
ncbi:uncharacterized protein TNCV_355801 [Trichonephila clavipes]|nr:uncharacterized protein TNCV_355801 [Trichonephila clavipes]